MKTQQLTIRKIKQNTTQHNTMTTTHTHFYYKGTTFPQYLKGENIAEDMKKTANEMIIMGLRNNVSLEEQKKDYKEQLDMIEEVMCEIIGNKSTQNKKECKKYLNKIAEYIGEPIDDINSLWMLNICALLKLNVIEDDNMNGILVAKFN